MDTKTSRYQKGMGSKVKREAPSVILDHGGKALTCWRKASSYALMGWATAAFRLFWRGIPGKSGPERPCMEEFWLSWEGLWLWSQPHRLSHTYWQFYLAKCCLPIRGGRQYLQVVRIPQVYSKARVLWDAGAVRQTDSKNKEESGGQRESEGHRGQKEESEFGDIVKMQILIPGVSDEACVLAFLAPTSWWCWSAGLWATWIARF